MNHNRVANATRNVAHNYLQSDLLLFVGGASNAAVWRKKNGTYLFPSRCPSVEQLQFLPQTNGEAKYMGRDFCLQQRNAIAH